MASDAVADLISDEMRGLIGKVQRRLSSYPISASDIRRWAIAVYYPQPAPAEYLRVGTAAGEPPLTAPEEFNPFAWALPGPPSVDDFTGPRALEQRAGVAPPAINFIVNGGTECEYGAPMQEGDVITGEFSIKSYAQKTGKRGPLLITETQDRWTNQRGEWVRSTVQTLVRY
jgi:MaoC dehydratase-like protein